MTTTVLVGLVLGLSAILVVLAVLVPREARRGVIVGLVMIALFGATSDSVPNSVSQLVQIFCAALLVVALVGAPRGAAAVRPTKMIFFVFLALSLLVTALNFPAADLLALRLTALAALTALVVSRFSSRDLRATMYCLIALAVIEVALGLGELLVTQTPIPWGYKVYADGSVFDNPNPLLGRTVARVQGSTGHPIPYAVVMTIGLAALAAVWRSRGVVFRVVVAVSCVLGLVLSGSRSAFVALAVAGVYLLLTSREGSRPLRIVLASFGALLGAIFFFADVADAIGELVGSGSFTNRSGALRSIPALLGRPTAEAIFGNGIGNQIELYQRGLLPQDGFFVVDNQLVTTLAATGVVGVVLMILVFVVGFRRAGRTARPFLLILAVMVFSFDYFVWVSLFTVLALALAIPPAEQLTSPTAPDRPGSPRRKADVAE